MRTSPHRAGDTRRRAETEILPIWARESRLRRVIAQEGGEGPDTCAARGGRGGALNPLRRESKMERAQHSDEKAILRLLLLHHPPAATAAAPPPAAKVVAADRSSGLPASWEEAAVDVPGYRSLLQYHQTRHERGSRVRAGHPSMKTTSQWEAIHSLTELAAAYTKPDMEAGAY